MTPTLIETVRVRHGVAPLWYLHLRRLVASCRALGVPFPLELTVPEGGEDRIHRLEVGPRGVAVSTRPPGSSAGVSLITSSVAHQPYPYKITARDQFDRAAAEARSRSADDALLLTAAGLVAEATIWCLFWWERDQLVAPPLELGILPGVSRMRLAELTAIGERRAGREALDGKAVFLANAARGVTPVTLLDGRPVPVHPQTSELARRFWP